MSRNTSRVTALAQYTHFVAKLFYFVWEWNQYVLIRAFLSSWRWCWCSMQYVGPTSQGRFGPRWWTHPKLSVRTPATTRRLTLFFFCFESATQNVWLSWRLSVTLCIGLICADVPLRNCSLTHSWLSTLYRRLIIVVFTSSRNNVTVTNNEHTGVVACVQLISLVDSVIIKRSSYNVQRLYVK